MSHLSQTAASQQDYPMNSIEDIALLHSSRGMAELKENLGSDYCLRAAECLLALKRGTVLLTTGFS